jgi:protein-L-isoaspartate(D-aspartate) O-methyltransferase
VSDLFDDQRRRMVERQLAARGITNARVLDAMAQVRREQFIDAELWPRAYDDDPLPLGQGATISQPYMVALMAQQLEIGPGDTVLEVGGGCGYAAAVYAQLARRVVSLEILPALAARGAANLADNGVGNAVLLCADGCEGYPAEAPFAATAVAAATPRVPPALLEQMAMGGRLVVPVGPADEQDLLLFRRTAAGWPRTSAGACRFVPLRLR